MDEYVGCIRQRVLERMDLSREMSDEEIENLIGEEASRLMQEEPISIRERLMLELYSQSECTSDQMCQKSEKWTQRRKCL